MHVLFTMATPFRAELATVSPSPSTAPSTVLIIDDNEEDLKYWSDSLRQSASHFTVLESSSAAGGLELCRSRAVDCVVLDLDMPESGFHVLLELVPERLRPKVAVIVLTHLPHPNLFEMAKHNGAQACLLKQSTSPQDLKQAIQQAVDAVKANQSPK
ncbi:MAG TPA: response regulator [Nitrospira sp.]|nr:response regulator [Nitrospira sp.]